jgi:hypothetical protein
MARSSILRKETTVGYKLIKEACYDQGTKPTMLATNGNTIATAPYLRQSRFTKRWTQMQSQILSTSECI